MHSWWSAPLGNVRVLLVCFAGTAFSSLETWPVSELKVASGKSKRKHCSKRISQEQDEKENTKKSRPFKEIPYRRAPVFLLSPGINTLGRTLLPCWIYSMSRGLVSTNQTFFASEMEQCPVRYTQGRLATLVPTVVQREGGWMEPLPGVFDMLQYFETILLLLESLWSSYQDELYFLGGDAAGGLWRHQQWSLSWPPSFQELEIRLKPRENCNLFWALHEK